MKYKISIIPIDAEYHILELLMSSPENSVSFGKDLEKRFKKALFCLEKRECIVKKEEKYYQLLEKGKMLYWKLKEISGILN